MGKGIIVDFGTVKPYKELILTKGWDSEMTKKDIEKANLELCQQYNEGYEDAKFQCVNELEETVNNYEHCSDWRDGLDNLIKKWKS